MKKCLAPNLSRQQKQAWHEVLAGITSHHHMLHYTHARTAFKDELTIDIGVDVVSELVQPRGCMDIQHDFGRPWDPCAMTCR